jgi:hypothetical protein
MKIYQELISIVTKHKRNNIKVIGLDKGESANQYDTLYTVLEEHPDISFDECRDLFFPPHKNKQFTNLLGGFKRRLTNALFLIDAKKSPSGTVKDAHFNTWKNLAASKILVRFYAFTAAEDIIKQTLPHSIATENYLVSSELYRMLGKFAGRRGDLKSSSSYFESYQNQINKHLGYSTACQLHLELHVQIANVRSAPDKFGPLANDYLRQIKTILETNSMDRIWVYYYHIAYFYLAIEKKPLEIIELMEDGIARLKDSNAVDKEIVGAVHHLLLINPAVVGLFEESINTFKYSENFVASGSLNWFISRESACLILLYYGNYNNALDLYTTTISHRSFKSLFPTKRENWVLIEAFLQLLLLTGKLTYSSGKKLKKFSLARFTNEVIVNNKDKQGFNTTFQILQILFLLHDQKWSVAEDKIMAIYKYTQRHFELEETDRTVCFVMVLTQLPRGGFSQPEVKSRSAEWLEKMQAIPPMQTTDPFEVEVIPYQKLWDIAIELLPVSH